MDVLTSGALSADSSHAALWGLHVINASTTNSSALGTTRDDANRRLEYSDMWEFAPVELANFLRWMHIRALGLFAAWCGGFVPDTVEDALASAEFRVADTFVAHLATRNACPTCRHHAPEPILPTNSHVFTEHVEECAADTVRAVGPTAGDGDPAIRCGLPSHTEFGPGMIAILANVAGCHALIAISAHNGRLTVGSW